MPKSVCLSTGVFILFLGRGEWVRHNEQIPWDEYCALADEFNPQNFDIHEWTDLAKDFGAKYTVMVTRHHDGLHCGTVREVIKDLQVIIQHLREIL